MLVKIVPVYNFVFFFVLKAHDKLEDGRKQVESENTLKLCREVYIDIHTRYIILNLPIHVSAIYFLTLFERSLLQIKLGSHL